MPNLLTIQNRNESGATGSKEIVIHAKRIERHTYGDLSSSDNNQRSGLIVMMTSADENCYFVVGPNLTKLDDNNSHKIHEPTIYNGNGIDISIKNKSIVDELKGFTVNGKDIQTWIKENDADSLESFVHAFQFAYSFNPPKDGQSYTLKMTKLAKYTEIRFIADEPQESLTATCCSFITSMFNMCRDRQQQVAPDDIRIDTKSPRLSP
jgi:hypothetical protein